MAYIFFVQGSPISNFIQILIASVSTFAIGIFINLTRSVLEYIRKQKNSNKVEKANSPAAGPGPPPVR